MRCPRCGITAIFKIHRTFLERVLTFMTAHRKWECARCGHRWTAKRGRGRRNKRESG